MQGIRAILPSMTWVGFAIKTPRKGWSRCSGYLITAHRGWHLSTWGLLTHDVAVGLPSWVPHVIFDIVFLGQCHSRKGIEMCGALGCVSQVLSLWHLRRSVASRLPWACSWQGRQSARGHCCSCVPFSATLAQISKENNSISHTCISCNHPTPYTPNSHCLFPDVFSWQLL